MTVRVRVRARASAEGEDEVESVHDRHQVVPVQTFGDCDTILDKRGQKQG